MLGHLSGVGVGAVLSQGGSTNAYFSDFFVWLDETGSDKRDHVLKWLTPPVYHRYLVRGTHLSTISALSSEGLIAHEIMTGT